MFKQMLENTIGEKLSSSLGIVNEPGKHLPSFEWVGKFRQSLDATTERLQAQFTHRMSFSSEENGIDGDSGTGDSGDLRPRRMTTGAPVAKGQYII